MPQWLVFGQYKIKRRSSIILADVKLWNPDSPIPHKPVLLESPTLDSVQSLLLRCDGAAGFPWRSSPPEVGLLKTQQRLSTCPSRVGAFISCCSIPNRLSWPFFIFGVAPFLHPCSQSFHLSWEFQKITKMYPAVSYCSTMPIFLKDPSHRSYSLCFLFKYSECYWPF